MSMGERREGGTGIVKEWSEVGAIPGVLIAQALGLKGSSDEAISERRWSTSLKTMSPVDENGLILAMLISLVEGLIFFGKCLMPGTPRLSKYWSIASSLETLWYGSHTFFPVVYLISNSASVPCP